MIFLGASKASPLAHKKGGGWLSGVGAGDFLGVAGGGRVMGVRLGWA